MGQILNLLRVQPAIFRLHETILVSRLEPIPWKRQRYEILFNGADFAIMP